MIYQQQQLNIVGTVRYSCWSFTHRLFTDTTQSKEVKYHMWMKE